MIEHTKYIAKITIKGSKIKVALRGSVLEDLWKQSRNYKGMVSFEIYEKGEKGLCVSRYTTATQSENVMTDEERDRMNHHSITYLEAAATK